MKSNKWLLTAIYMIFMSATSRSQCFSMLFNCVTIPSWNPIEKYIFWWNLTNDFPPAINIIFVSTRWQVCFSMFSSNNHLVSQLFLHGSQRTRRADGLKEPVSVDYYIVVMNRRKEITPAFHSVNLLKQLIKLTCVRLIDLHDQLYPAII